MSRKLSLAFAESAVSDLEAIVEYYEGQDAPETGRRIVAQIVNKAERLATFPDMGRVVPEYGLECLRELIDLPFRIVYLREKGSVRIVRVWRSEGLLNVEDQG